MTRGLDQGSEAHPTLRNQPDYAADVGQLKMDGFPLPVAPTGESGPVKAWAQPVTIPTYLPEAPDQNPMFLENRVYQGSSGRVYPLPFIDRISTERGDVEWQAVHLENEFVRVMVLPQLGGRIHIGLDKTNGYDFFYRQNSIKPALVGLAGPWISGGVEFNWPQHHRPATYLPVEFEIESHADGSRTIWCSDHDPLTRMKGMHGVCLYPGRSYIELKVRLYNRTPFVQTFLWWANVATRVHGQYQSVFPPDVHYVADHARRAMSTYPRCTGTYYGVDYAARAPHNDLGWYANIPVPTSYMAIGSQEDFVGGYDHSREAGLLHIANHHISPGKKQWTWGNREFGCAWDRNLSDDAGPYIELMAGVYTDNQPDFSFLAPYETRCFSQYWYPVQKIGPPQKANLDAALSLQVSGGIARIGVSVSSPFPGAIIRLERGGEVIAEWVADLAPGLPFVGEAPSPENGLVATVTASRELIRYAPVPADVGEAPLPATEPPLPADIATTDELYLTGLHLDQYRHATRHPEDYWREALRRNPSDTRSGNAMGVWHLKRGEFAESERHLRRAIAALTKLNPNPYDGEAYYNLGLALRFQGRDDEAYATFYKATWNAAWRSPAFYALAEFDCRRGQWQTALEHLRQCLRVNVDHNNARNLTAVVLRRLGRNSEAADLLRETLAFDPLDAWARHLSGRPVGGNNQLLLDIAFDCARAGLPLGALAGADLTARDGSVPILLYLQGRYAEAAQAPPDYCFPSRLEELLVLQEAPSGDARAQYYLGNLLYDRRRYHEAIACWQRSVELDPGFSIAWRNLGIGCFNVLGKPTDARQAFDRAFLANPNDARLLYERDQLWKRIGELPARRLAQLEQHPHLVQRRDDLSVELGALYNQTGQPEKALAVIGRRPFQPWEGGEGLALGQHVRTHLKLGRGALARGENEKAHQLFETALTCPENLGEARHALDYPTEIYYWLGDFESAAQGNGYYAALALERMGRHPEAQAILTDMLDCARRHAGRTVQVDYFATSLPAMLLFNDDLQKRNTIEAMFLEAQALLGLGQDEEGRRLLQRVLELDQNHAGAADVL